MTDNVTIAPIETDGRFGGREGLDPADWMIHQPLLAAGYRCG